MKLLILGATGHVGHLLLEQALAQDHTVVALVRNPAKVTLIHPRLTVVSGNLTDPSVLTPLMADCAAVLSALGHNSLATSDIQTAATRAILVSLKPHQRVISLAGSGIPDPSDQPSLGSWVVAAGIKLVPGELYLDGLRHVRLLRDSTADWVVVRSVPMLGNQLTHHYRTGYFPVGLFATASRGDVADFMLANLATDQWLHQAPLIARQ